MISWLNLISRQNSFLGSRRVGINKYVLETSEEIPAESLELVRSEGEPRPKLAVTLSPVSTLICERKWIDINPASFNEGCFAVSKFMIRLVRHDETIPGEDDGAVRFDDLIEKFKVKFVGTSEWTVDAWTIFLAKEEDQRKGFNTV